MSQHIEDSEQMALFEWAQYQSGKYPELALLFHVPNGGKRNAREAARFKRMGVKPGVPDLFLPVSRGGFYGLFIELKAHNGRVSENQGKWLRELYEQGYAVCVCFGFEEAKRDIIRYLDWKM
ncbi:MAG: VRR-NUC domain-containing protein [Oscillospiraceae bacterium]|nr:VRR-NUC domain-containing protein [Oscillospiraceae bacterium]